MRIHTVIDSDARIRGGPPSFRWLGRRRIRRYARVRVLSTHGRYARVRGLLGKRYGWTAQSNLGLYFKDARALQEVSLHPAVALETRASWSWQRRVLANLYNRLGGLMAALSRQTGIETAAALAVWYVETSGRHHQPGRAVIRFENHHLFRLWGDRKPQTYDRHFRHGGRGDIGGRAWQNHAFRESRSGAFESVHRGQASEYRALELAVRLAGEQLALPCMSIGGPQILVSNHLQIGYRTPVSMYGAFQESEREHVLGFFDFCQYAAEPGALLRFLKNRRWTSFAAVYNGPGQAETYGGRIAAAHREALRVLG